MKKKSIIILILFFVQNNLFAQKFELTPSGFKNASDSSKNYIIISDSSKSANQLYNKCLAFISETYKNPDKVIKAKTDSEYIRFETFSPNVFEHKFRYMLILPKQHLGLKSTIELHFKAGKVKYEITSSDMVFNIEPAPVAGVGLCDIIFNERQKTKSADSEKLSIENHYNLEVENLKIKIFEKGGDW